MQEMSKTVWDYMPFYSRFTRYIRKQNYLLRNSSQAIEFHFLKRIMLNPRGYRCLFLKLIGCLNCPRRQTCGRFLLLLSLGSSCDETPSIWGQLIIVKEGSISKCHFLIDYISIFPYHAMELLCSPFSALSSSSRNLYDEANKANSAIIKFCDLGSPPPTRRSSS